MGSPSRNVQYHPPRLSEDRLNLPQPHSPSLPTHCTAPGNRECAHPVLLTVDHFEVAPDAMAAVDACVAALAGAQREPAGEDASAYVLLRPDDSGRPDGEHTVLGWLRLDPEALRIETNSRARADALRARVEGACGSGLRHRAREHMDPLEVAKQPGQALQPPSPASPEQQRLVAEFKERHYAAWLDQPLPALNQKTPRQCVGTAAGRAAVDLLLKDMEHMEQRAPGASFDFTAIRRALGMAPHLSPDD